MAPAKPSRKRLYIGIVLAVVLVGAVAGFVGLKGASSDIDPTKIATAEAGTMVKSVVATGKIEPTTKVEIKSRAKHGSFSSENDHALRLVLRERLKRFRACFH